MISCYHYTNQCTSLGITRSNPLALPGITGKKFVTYMKIDKYPVMIDFWYLKLLLSNLFVHEIKKT